MGRQFRKISPLAHEARDFVGEAWFVCSDVVETMSRNWKRTDEDNFWGI